MTTAGSSGLADAITCAHGESPLKKAIERYRGSNGDMFVTIVEEREHMGVPKSVKPISHRCVGYDVCHSTTVSGGSRWIHVRLDTQEESLRLVHLSVASQPWIREDVDEALNGTLPPDHPIIIGYPPGKAGSGFFRGRHTYIVFSAEPLVATALT
jgi:hypothetical protein